MTADALLSRVDHVKQTGTNRWIARCPGHDDRGPSLAVRELDDGRVLIHCFAGCSAHEIVAAAGISFADLFPPSDSAVQSQPRERRPFAAMDVLRCIAREALIVAVAASNLARGHHLLAEDLKRLLRASERITAAVDLAEGAA